MTGDILIAFIMSKEVGCIW